MHVRSLSVLQLQPQPPVSLSLSVVAACNSTYRVSSTALCVFVLYVSVASLCAWVMNTLVTCCCKCGEVRHKHPRLHRRRCTATRAVHRPLVTDLSSPRAVQLANEAYIAHQVN